ncbi:uncharacterized protein LOC101851709 [Aplysia californica]|uniref:Uncharacterized protein LOC101851709 n=1 Tax=Aplysia californica TaxID=6500 RepID=A0ABM0JES7_APLCA|nr:uncharacterized protein LOC101851709 [Aplysia californica]
MRHLVFLSLVLLVVQPLASAKKQPLFCTSECDRFRGKCLLMAKINCNGLKKHLKCIDTCTDLSKKCHTTCEDKEFTVEAKCWRKCHRKRCKSEKACQIEVFHKYMPSIPWP